MLFELELKVDIARDQYGSRAIFVNDTLHLVDAQRSRHLEFDIESKEMVLINTLDGIGETEIVL